MQPAARIAAMAGFLSRGAARVGVPTWAQGADEAMVRPVLSDLTSRLGSNLDPLAAWVADPAKLCTADP